jgi:hypothetical protein
MESNFSHCSSASEVMAEFQPSQLEEGGFFPQAPELRSLLPSHLAHWALLAFKRTAIALR